MNDKIVAVIALKIRTREGTFFMYPVTTVRDSVIDEDDILYSSDGKQYYSWMDPEFYKDDEVEFCYMYPVFHSNLQNMYKHKIFSENIIEYVCDLTKNIYFTTINTDGTLNNVMINQDKIKEANPSLYLQQMACQYDQNGVMLKIPESIVNQIYDYAKNEQIDEIKNLFEQYKLACVKVKELFDKESKAESNESIEKEQKHEKKKKTPKKEVKQLPAKSSTSSKTSVSEIYDSMKSEIIGQDETIKKVLSSLDMDSYSKNPREKRRLLIIGQTGSGKTQIMRSLSNILCRPLVVVDTTQITVSGYVGGTIEDNILRPLLEASSGDINIAQNGIVDLDEIDKKGSNSNSDVSGRGVLNSLLPFIDGTTYNVKFNSKIYQFDTSNLSIFATGAFTNVFDNVKNSRNLGFGKEESNYKNVSVDEIIKVGNIPNEFMGRFSKVSVMNELTLENYKDILLKSKISDLKFVQNYLMDCYGVELLYDDSFVTEVAKKAIKLKLGGRSLKRIIDETLEEALWKILTEKDTYKTLVLNGETVNSKKYYLK